MDNIDTMELGNLLWGNSRGQYHVPRGFTDETFEWQYKFADFLEAIGCDWYGYLDKKATGLIANSRGGITTSKFEINPYYWGDDDEEAKKHNFIYYPTGYELDWYKYPLRDSYSNRNISFEEFCDMLDDCQKEFTHE